MGEHESERNPQQPRSRLLARRARRDGEITVPDGGRGGGGRVERCCSGARDRSGVRFAIVDENRALRLTRLLQDPEYLDGGVLDQSAPAGEDGQQQGWSDAGVRCSCESGRFDAGGEVRRAAGSVFGGYAAGGCGALDAVACWMR